MISMSKNQILKELENMKQWISLLCMYPNTSILELSSNMHIESFRVYQIINDLRHLSYYEDSYLDMMNNEDIDLNNIKERIFVNKSDKLRFSNKQIIKYIRNAFSHSEGDKELYKISVNGKYLEIYLKNTKPIPFHIKMSILDLEEIILELKAVCTVFYLSLIEDNKIKRVYLKDKIDSHIFIDIINKYYQEYKYFDYQKYGKYVLKYFDNLNLSYEIKEYMLIPEQISIINKYQKIIDNSKNDQERNIYNSFMVRTISKIIPLGEEKLNIKKDNLLFLNLLYNYPANSFNSLKKELENTAYNLMYKRVLNDIQKEIYDNIGFNIDRLLLFDERDLINDSYMEYLIYYITTIDSNDKVKIGNKEYDREFIRNSFAHGRWFIDEDNYLILCDCKTGLKYDYEFHTIDKIHINNLLSYVYNSQYSHNKALKR